jgi:cystathionine gamma-synthase
MTDKPDLKPETLAAHGGRAFDPERGDLAPPIRPSTNFARDETYEQIGGQGGYSRDDSPSYPGVEALLARLEGGAGALVFASGMAAATAVWLSLAPGDHVVAPKVVYWGLRDWLLQFAANWGVSVDLFDQEDAGALARAVKSGATKLVWIETPCNPTWDVIDIAAAAEVAHAAGARLAVDSTVATPVLTRPLELGADLVFHSGTKYLNGHGDVMAGVLVTARADDFWTKLRDKRHRGGGVLGAFEAWLLHRGLRTLYLRVGRASQSALAIARHFEGHPKLAAVLYPGLDSHPGHAVAKRQMAGGFGGMLSLRTRGGAEAALEVARRVRVFVRATSLGGVESLIEHRASIEGPTSPVPADLLRLSIGIEDAGDLIADLEQALAGA